MPVAGDLLSGDDREPIHPKVRLLLFPSPLVKLHPPYRRDGLASRLESHHVLFSLSIPPVLTRSGDFPFATVAPDAVAATGSVRHQRPMTRV